MKHLIIGGHDGVSFAMCGKDGTGPDFADRQPEDGDCPECLEVWRECDPDAIDKHWQDSVTLISQRWDRCNIKGGRRDVAGRQVVSANIQMPFGFAHVSSYYLGPWSLTTVPTRGNWYLVRGDTFDAMIEALRANPGEYGGQVLAAMTEVEDGL